LVQIAIHPVILEILLHRLWSFLRFWPMRLWSDGVVPFGTESQEDVIVSKAQARDAADANGAEVRKRILDGAFEAFMKNGFAASSTLEIATRARVSKRDLYALVGNKQSMLVACIRARAQRLQVPADIPIARDRATLAQVLASFGAKLVQEITDPTVIAVFRLAIAEAVGAPEVAQALDSIGRETSRAALRQIIAGAERLGIVRGEPAELAEQFGGLLWGNLMVSLLLGVVKRPSLRELGSRARAASDAFLRLNSSV
jgi:AcrR family transcriptional regulator